MRKKILIPIFVIILFALVIYFFTPKLSKEEEDLLYSDIEKVVIDTKQEDLNDFKTFISIKRFGYDIDKENTYIYCWIQKESFFVNEDGLVEMYSGLSMPYKFTFTDGKYIGYDYPKDGNRYEESIKKIFPFYVRRKFSSIYDDDYLKSEIIKQVESYYHITEEEIYY